MANLYSIIGTDVFAGIESVREMFVELRASKTGNALKTITKIFNFLSDPPSKESYDAALRSKWDETNGLLIDELIEKYTDIVSFSKMIFCQECEGVIEETEKFCPWCGARLTEDEKYMRGDLYAILEIETNAGHEEIQEAFRRLSQIWHPDKYSSKNRKRAEKIYKAISSAYDVLGNDTYMAAYKRALQRFKDAFFSTVPEEVKEKLMFFMEVIEKEEAVKNKLIGEMEVGKGSSRIYGALVKRRIIEEAREKLLSYDSKTELRIHRLGMMGAPSGGEMIFTSEYIYFEQTSVNVSISGNTRTTTTYKNYFYMPLGLLKEIVIDEKDGFALIIRDDERAKLEVMKIGNDLITCGVFIKASGDFMRRLICYSIARGITVQCCSLRKNYYREMIPRRGAMNRGLAMMGGSVVSIWGAVTTLVIMLIKCGSISLSYIRICNTYMRFYGLGFLLIGIFLLLAGIVSYFYGVNDLKAKTKSFYEKMNLNLYCIRENKAETQS